MAFWTLLTTTIYTIILGIPTILVSMISKTGIAPYKIGKAWAWLLAKTNGVKIEIIDMHKLAKDKSYVFISNHLSHLDTVAIIKEIPHSIRFVAKKSLSKIPFFGWAARLARMIFIDRSDKNSAMKTINKAINELKNGISVLFFAEGTRSTNGKLGKFKKGAFFFSVKSKLPIVPITIINSNKLLPRGKLGIKKGIIKIVIGDPIETVNYEEKDMDFIIDKVKNIITKNSLHFNTPKSA